jgi:hypothetical protein
MDKKSQINASMQKAQINSQQAAMNHQMHIQSVTTLTKLLEVTPAESPILPHLNSALIALLEPFIPLPTPSIITN